MDSKKIRQAYLEFFKNKEHTIVPSSPLIPFGDQTLLFTNAGMVQFKKYWATEVPLPYKRAVTCQKCIRAGGKDSDLEKIGKSGKHHTFFEMLGNFSFGDYFKEETIKWAYEFAIDVLKIPENKIWVSYYEEDEQTKEIWKKFLPEERIVALGKKDNFWGPAGDTGPCGPCTELYFDYGKEKSCGRDNCLPGCDCDRFLEFWNLVFPQYNMQKDGTLLPLKRRGVDTGMGLERITRILQGKETNYETDLFLPIIKKIEQISGIEYQNKISDFRIIADHIRAITFLIVDNILPSNEGRGYVLRRLIRRGCISGMNLSLNGHFLYKLSEVVVNIMKDVYPELEKNNYLVNRIVFEEEDKFYSIIDSSKKIFYTRIKDIKGKTIPGEIAFNLYETYGIPKDLIEEFSIENNYEVDWDGFERKMAEMKNFSRICSSIGFTPKRIFEADSIVSTEFTGYEKLNEESIVVALYSDEKLKRLSLVLDKTSFYPEKGGQIGDRGIIENKQIKFVVDDTQIDEKGFIHHIGQLERGNIEDIKIGMRVKCLVDKEFRKKVSINHTSTHLLHYALREIIGKEVRQAGSYVGEDKLRFDFVCFSPIDEEKIKKVEEMVQEKIFCSSDVKIEVMLLEDVFKKDIVALFMEKYENNVRVINIGDYHSEVCGGTHIKNTSEVFLFKIISFSSIGKNLKRVEAITYKEALKYLNNGIEAVKELSNILNIPEEKIIKKVKELVENVQEKEKLVEKYVDRLLTYRVEDILKKDIQNFIIDGKEVKFLGKLVDVERKENLDKMVDILIEKIGTGIVVIASKLNEQVYVLVKVSKDISKNISAGEIIKEILPFIKGKGGGSNTFAQASGEKIDGFQNGLKYIMDNLEKVKKNDR